MVSTLFANADCLTWNVHVVVDGECVYSKIDQITSAKINQTTQICCRRSGVHARYQEEMEIDCCGGKYLISVQTTQNFVYIRTTFHVSKLQYEKGKERI